MKKLISLILILLSALGLSGCARDRCAIPNRLDLLLLRKNPLPAYDSQASGRMFSHMGGSRALVQGTFLYTIELDGEHRPVLARYSLENAQLSQPVTLVELCAPQWICADGPFIFYVNALQDRRLERLNTETLETCVLVDEPCSYLQIKDKLLYYRGENNFLYSCDMDGQRRNTVLDKACCYPWFLGDALLYQSESEGDILKLRFFGAEESRELALTDEAAYAPVLIEDRLYYTQGMQVRSMGINGMDPATLDSPPVSGAAEFILENGRWQVRAVSDDYGIHQWSLPLEGGDALYSPHSGYLLCDYMDGNWRVDGDYFADARLRSMLLYWPEGGKSEYLYAETVKRG